MRVLFFSILTMLLLFSCKSVKKSQHVEKSDVVVNKVDTSSKVVMTHVDTTVKKGVTTIKTTTIEIDHPVYTTEGHISVGFDHVHDTIYGNSIIGIGGWNGLQPGWSGNSNTPIGGRAGSKPTSGGGTFSADRIRAHILEETTDTSSHAGVTDSEVRDNKGLSFDSAASVLSDDSSSVKKGGNTWLIYTVIGLVLIFLGALYFVFKKGII